MLYFFCVVFIFGIVIGSFLNVCIYRLPLHENIATTGSHCMSCGHQLRWYDLVPLLSWLSLKGRCRYCKAGISVQYPLIEFVNGVGYVLIFVFKGFSLDAGILCLFSSALLVLSVIDARTFEIPVGINITILLLGVVRTFLDYQNVLSHLIGFLCVSLFLLLLNLFTGGRAMGGGDVKLMGAAGLLLGWKLIILSFLLACIMGSLVHPVLMKVKKLDRRLAFGPYLSAAMFIALMFGDSFINWYLGILL